MWTSKGFLKAKCLDAQTISVLLFAVLRQIFCLRAYTLVICSYKAFYSGRPLICICDSSFYDRKRQTLYLFSTHCFTTRTSTAVLNQGGTPGFFITVPVRLGLQNVKLIFPKVCDAIII